MGHWYKDFDPLGHEISSGVAPKRLRGICACRFRGVSHPHLETALISLP